MKSKEKINKDYNVFRTLRFHWGVFCELLFIRRKMSGIECCFVRFYAVSADCTDRITLDEIDKNRWTGDLIRT